MDYTNKINGFTFVNLTKLDVLDHLDELKIGHSYKYKGELLKSYPSQLEVLKEVEVVYETFKGWKCDISGAKTYNELPKETKKYVEAIEKFAKVNIKWIGTGVSRDAMVEKK
jgi:adenylosuccinate synthase